jgi:hypothetical protein
LLFALKPRASHAVAKEYYGTFVPPLFHGHKPENNNTSFADVGLLHNFTPQHIYGYAFVVKLLQLHVLLRFSAPRYYTYSKIWV